MKTITVFRKVVLMAVPALFAVLAILPAAQAESKYNQISAGVDWCGTQRLFDLKQAQLYGAATAPEACDQRGVCDDPTIRDGWIPDVDDPIMYVRMIVHVLAEDDGSHVYSTPEHVAGQVEQLNIDFAPAGIQFIHQYHQVNATIWRSLAEDEIDDMKSATAIEPDKYLNVWVTVVEFSYSFATFPWYSDALLPTGGVVMGHFHWNELPNRVFAHEVGHSLGLYHTFHGVDEVSACGPCYETPGSNSPLIGDLCADTPPTPTNSGPCTDFTGADSCSGEPWGYTMPENYMGYASQVCLNTFTPEQRGRMRCWTNNGLDGWVDPFQIEAATTLGPSPLPVDFTSTTHKEATGWHWDFGDGSTSEEASPSHTFSDPGIRTVTVDLQTPSGTYQREYTEIIGAYADTLAIDTALASESVALVDVYVQNFLPLDYIQIPISWDGPIDADLNVVTTSGWRSENLTASIISLVPAWNAATILLQGANGVRLEPGHGPVVTLRFIINSAATGQIMPVSIFEYAGFNLKFGSPPGEYRPVAYDGQVKISCCQGVVGDVNGDRQAEPTIGDVSYLIDHLFVNGIPLECYLEADANQSGGNNPVDADITIGDVSLLIDHLYISGVALNECP